MEKLLLKKLSERAKKPKKEAIFRMDSTTFFIERVENILEYKAEKERNVIVILSGSVKVNSGEIENELPVALFLKNQEEVIRRKWNNNDNRRE